MRINDNPEIEVYNIDCIKGMKDYSDKYFELAIVDPPYGIRIGWDKTFGKIGGDKITSSSIYKMFDDKRPKLNYFLELTRISINQIIWGGNYFIDYLYSTPCFIVWDKDNTGNFADCELAWTSFKTATRRFKWMWNGLFQENMANKEIRIHPTQKPVALYTWLLKNYAQKGDKIIDTHLGSGSIAIACYNLGFDLIGYEIDKDYHKAFLKRFEKHIRQRQLFPLEKENKNESNRQTQQILSA